MPAPRSLRARLASVAVTLGPRAWARAASAAAVGLAVAVAAAASAGAQAVPGGALPAGCAVPGLVDRIGTAAGELVVAGSAGARVYGLDGDDWVVGSLVRPSCLFGGAGDDVVTLTDPGGIGLGEPGDDVLTGAAGSDALTGGPGADALAAAGGADVLRGGPGVDGLAGGEGDDLLESLDGRAEVVDCGGGRDTALADRADVLLECEAGRLRGRPLPRAQVRPRAGGPHRVFRVRFRAPRAAPAGAYRVLVAACGRPLRQAATAPAPGRTAVPGQALTVRLRPSPAGWCRGAATGLVVEQPACPVGRACRTPRPVAPVGRLVLRVR